MEFLKAFSGEKSKNEKKLKSPLDFLQLTSSDDSFSNKMICWRLKTSATDFDYLYNEKKASEVWEMLAMEQATIKAQIANQKIMEKSK